EAFARSRADYLTRNGRGPQYIRMDLRRRGIPTALIAAALAEGDIAQPASQRERILPLARKKLATLARVAPEARYRRLAGFLARR
ncbi:RecX family transcriptional regulator, partial [Klebsiella pneumoniae]|nr:RecX family transcriptional regulator [Klebsiella pneumoniae]